MAASSVFQETVEDLQEGDVFTFGFNTGGRLLTTRILSTPTFQQLFRSLMLKLMSTFYNILDPSSIFLARLSAMYQAIQPAVEQDCWHRLDLSYAFEEFVNNANGSIVQRPYYLTRQGPLLRMVSYAAVISDWASLRDTTALMQLMTIK